MKRRLFCELSPFCYQISTLKCCALRSISDALSPTRFACTKQSEVLPFRCVRHTSLILRKLAQVDDALQQGKAINLALSVPRVTGVLIRPGETFSFWHLAGIPSARRGYALGLTLSNGRLLQDIGGGMCQFTNLIHWLALHTPLTIVEHHHHDGIDIFPDAGRTVPFGTGTSILYNYLDYRFRNDTSATYQLIVHTDGYLLTGELRCTEPPACLYEVTAENDRFVREGDLESANRAIYRCGRVVRTCKDKKTGAVLSQECIKENRARVLYDVPETQLSPVEILR